MQLCAVFTSQGIICDLQALWNVYYAMVKDIFSVQKKPAESCTYSVHVLIFIVVNIKHFLVLFSGSFKLHVQIVCC